MNIVNSNLSNINLFINPLYDIYFLDKINNNIFIGGIFMKKWISLVIVAVMVLSLAACGTSGSSNQQTPKDVDGETSATVGSNDGAPYDTKAELRMIWWGSQTRHDYTQAAINVFQDAYPITITPEFTAWDAYWEKLAQCQLRRICLTYCKYDYKVYTQ